MAYSWWREQLSAAKKRGESFPVKKMTKWLYLRLHTQEMRARERAYFFGCLTDTSVTNKIPNNWGDSFWKTKDKKTKYTNM